MARIPFDQRFPEHVAALRAAYAEAHRAYHNWGHIEALLADFRRLEDRFANPEAVEMALYWHDAVYDPTSKTNEADSAERMLSEMRGRVAPEVLRWAETIVRATVNHRVPDDAGPELAADCALFLDMDLAILGAAPEAFDAYDAAIRQEYAAIPDLLYLPGRKTIMAGFLKRERLYLTDTFHRTHDAPARANLRRLIGRLTLS